MRKGIKAALLAVSIAGFALTLVGCKGAGDRTPPSLNVVPRAVIGDGIWVVGKDEIPEGLWSPEQDIAKMKGCVWFVSPPEGKTDPNQKLPGYKDGYAGKVTVRLKNEQTFTTSGCGKWDLVG